MSTRAIRPSSGRRHSRRRSSEPPSRGREIRRRIGIRIPSGLDATGDIRYRSAPVCRDVGPCRWKSVRMARSLDVSWVLDGITMEGTVARPDGDGPFPAVVLVAGSGPTDRDWCSPLLPGSNGSGRLFAEAFADAGIASLRYDKRVSGAHAMENVQKLF